MVKKIKLKGHESFSIREGWLVKGITEIKKSSTIFSSKNATTILGIGTNMVKSLKYWLLATKLIKMEKKGRYILSELGELINRYDQYMEDIFTLYFLHYSMVTNENECFVWNVFFNKCNSKIFNKKEILEQIKYELENVNKEYNENLLKDEINVLLKTYVIDEKIDNPENNFTCPLTELRLIKRIDKDTYQKEISRENNLSKYIVFFAILVQCGGHSINIEDLLKKDNSVSKLFNLDKFALNEYLEILRKEKLITINKTAGINMIYIEKIYDLVEIFVEYFERGK